MAEIVNRPARWVRCRSGKHEWSDTRTYELERCCNGWVAVWTGGPDVFTQRLIPEAEYHEMDTFGSSKDCSHLTLAM